MYDAATSNSIRKVSGGGSLITIEWGDGHESRFHAMWLRHARDMVNPNGPTERRLVSSIEAEPDIAQAHCDEEGNLVISWRHDGAVSMHRASWLRENCYSAAARLERQRPLRLWDASLGADMPQIDYVELEGSDEGALTMLEQVLDYGFTIVRNVPPVHGKVLDLAGHFGLCSPSPYADDPAEPRLENIRVNPKLQVATRKSDFLGPHTDTCWRTSLSGLIYLHCLKSHGSGGLSIIVDGFAVAERMRAQAPQHFKTLAETPLNFTARVSNGDDWRARGRVISLGPDGEVCGIRFGAPSILHLDLPEDQMEPVLRALKLLEDMLYDEGMWVMEKLQPGDLVVCDNQRVLHGRTAFEGASEGERHMQTCSTRRDEFHNRYRHLARKLGRGNWSQELSMGVV